MSTSEIIPTALGEVPLAAIGAGESAHWASADAPDLDPPFICGDELVAYDARHGWL